MKIGYLSTFYPLRGGISQFNASLYHAFEAQHEIKAFTFKRQYPSLLFPGKSQYVSSEDKADKIDSIEILDTINPFSYSKTAKAIRSFSPDLLIMKYWMSFFAPSLGTVAKKMNSKTKVISILDNVIPHEKRFFDIPFTKYFLRQNDGFVVMSDTVKEDLLSLTSGNVKYLRKDHPIYDHFGKKTETDIARNKLKISPNKKTILFFGFIRDYKGLDLLIKAFGNLDESYQLLIAGECYGSFDKYRNLIEESVLKNNIHLFNDYIDDDKVPDFFCASDVCVLPYKSATQSGITSIANHFDIPVIATDVGGLHENIIHDKTGIIVKKPYPELIATSVKRYFDSDLRNEFAKHIRSLKSGRSWTGFAHEIVEFSKTLP